MQSPKNFKQETQDNQDNHDLQDRQEWQESQDSHGQQELEEKNRVRIVDFSQSGFSPMTGPLREAVIFALNRNRDAVECWADLEPDQHRTPAFTFCRYLLPHPDLLSEPDDFEVLALVEDVLIDLYGPDDPWGDALGYSDSAGKEVDPVADFLHCWSAVYSPIGSDALEWAHYLARERPRSFPHTGRSKAAARYREFLNVAYWLQRRRQGAPIIVACEAWGKELGVTARTISTFRRQAEREGILIMLRKGATGRGASECRFDEAALARLKR